MAKLLQVIKQMDQNRNSQTKSSSNVSETDWLAYFENNSDWLKN